MCKHGELYINSSLCGWWLNLKKVAVLSAVSFKKIGTVHIIFGLSPSQGLLVKKNKPLSYLLFIFLMIAPAMYLSNNWGP